MDKSRKASEAAAAAPPAPKGFVPGPGFQRVSIEQPKLDCSDVGLGDDQELWLLQLPHDFPVGEPVSWELSQHAQDGYRGRCTVQGVEYELVPEKEALATDLFASPASEHGSVVLVARRMTVVRATPAPLLCFGHAGTEVEAVVERAVFTKKPSAAGKKLLPPPVAAAAAAATKEQQRGAEGQQEASAARGAGAAAAGPSGSGPADQQQQQPGEKKKRKQDAEGGSGEQEAAVKKERKDKSAKKEKKEKKDKGKGAEKEPKVKKEKKEKKSKS